MKKNPFLRAAAMLMVLSVATSSMLLRGFFASARYTARIGKEETLSIAEFSVHVGTNEENAVEIVPKDGKATAILDVNLFDTITEWFGPVGTPGVLQDDELPDLEVAMVGGKNIYIAPGTNGAVTLYVKNRSMTDIFVKAEISGVDFQYIDPLTGEAGKLPTLEGVLVYEDLVEKVRRWFKSQETSGITVNGIQLDYADAAGGTTIYNGAPLEWEWPITDEFLSPVRKIALPTLNTPAEDFEYEFSAAHGGYLVAGCNVTSPTSITLPKETPDGQLVVGVAANAFSSEVMDNSKLEGIFIPEGYTFLGDKAFYGVASTDVFRIYIPPSVETIGADLFRPDDNPRPPYAIFVHCDPGDLATKQTMLPTSENYDYRWFYPWIGEPETVTERQNNWLDTFLGENHQHFSMTVKLTVHVYQVD